MIAFLPGGGGPIAIPLLLLVAWFFLQRPWLRIICGALLIGWFILVVARAIANQEFNILIFPSLVLLAWFLISEIKRSFGKEN
jgi:hypothetical protein